MSRTTRLLPWLVAALLVALPAVPAGADPWDDPADRAAAAGTAPYPGGVPPQDVLTPGAAYRATLELHGRPARMRHRDGTHLLAPVGTSLNAQALLWPLALED